MAGIALSQLRHEISVEHSLPHLLLISLSLSQFIITLCVESSNSCLVEHLLLLDIGEHLMNPGVIGALQHYSILGSIHLVDGQWSVTLGILPALLSHSIGHEEGLVGFLSAQPRRL